MVVARHHIIQYVALYLILLAGGSFLVFQLAVLGSVENPWVDPLVTSGTLILLAFIYPLPVLSLGRPLPLLQIDSTEFWPAAWFLDLVLNVMVLVYVLLGGIVILVIARAFDAPFAPTLLVVLVLSYLWLSKFIIEFRTLWLYEGTVTGYPGECFEMLQTELQFI